MTTAQLACLEGALDAALSLRRPVAALGRAVWLFLALLRAAHRTGTVLRTREHLSQDLGVPEASIDDWVSRLVGVKLIEVRNPAPYLVIQIRSWSADGPHSEGNQRVLQEAPPPTANSVPVSSSSNDRTATALRKKNWDGGPGEGIGLRERLRAELPDLPEPELAAVLRVYSAAAVERALERLRRVPDGKIRKSRLALFRFLLTKTKQADHATTPPDPT